METLQRLDYISIIIYMVLIAGVGILFGWFVKDIKDYFKGGNTIPWVMGGVSNFMGLFSTFVFVAYAGIAYSDGLVGVTVLWCTVLPGIIMILFFAKRWLRSGIITPVEYLEKRFNAPVRQIFSWAGIGMRFLDNMVRLYAIGIFIMAATPLTFFQAIVLAGAIITLFTIVGGVWAVVVIDTLQFVVLIFSACILVVLAWDAVGGLDSLMASHPEHFNWFSGVKGQPLWLIAYYIMVIIKYNGNWIFIQRFYSVKDEKSSIKLGLLTASLFFIFPLIFLFPAIAAIEILPNLPDPEMAYVSTATYLLPPGLMGFMIAAMFSATMSSLNSEYNVMSGVLTNDIYKRIFRPDKSDMHYVWVARGNILLIGLIMMVGALFVGQLGGAFEANKLLTGIFAIPIAIPLMFGLVLRKPNPVSAILTIIVGIITGLVLNLSEGVSWEIATLTEIGVCMGTFVISGLIKKNDPRYQERVNEFFKKINTPLKKEEIPVIDPKFKKAISLVFAISLGLCGLLFSLMSIPSISLLSGKLSMGGGIVCLLLSMFFFIRIVRVKMATNHNN